MIYLLNIFIIFITTILSISFLPNFNILGVVPLLPLFYIIGLTYFRKGSEPILLAALAGVLMDFFSSFGFGLYLGIFLGLAVVVRLLFQEGMKVMSFTSFLTLSALGLISYFGIEIFLLNYGKVIIVWPIMGLEFIKFMFVNMVFGMIFYFFNNWYFEKVLILENYQKRR